MSGQFDRDGNNAYYWTLTPYGSSKVRRVGSNGGASNSVTSIYPYGIRPALNLKQNVIITSGDGTKENPFEIALQ